MFLAFAGGPLAAQGSNPTLPGPAMRFASMTAVTGYEQSMVNSLIALLPGAARDRAGNAVVVLGAGQHRRLVACPLSEPGFVVGGVRGDGWLTLRRAGQTPPVVERQLEGQRVTVAGARDRAPAAARLGPDQTDTAGNLWLTMGRGEPTWSSSHTWTRSGSG